MAALDSEEIKKALRTKLRCTEETGKDHIRYSLWEGDVLLARTMLSHGPRHDVGDVLISKMTKQIKLGTSKNFREMVECPLSREACLEIIKAAVR